MSPLAGNLRKLTAAERLAVAATNHELELHIDNIESSTVAFRIKSPVRNRYFVKPNSGDIPPRCRFWLQVRVADHGAGSSSLQDALSQLFIIARWADDKDPRSTAVRKLAVSHALMTVTPAHSRPESRSATPPPAFESHLPAPSATRQMPVPRSAPRAPTSSLPPIAPTARARTVAVLSPLAVGNPAHDTNADPDEDLAYSLGPTPMHPATAPPPRRVSPAMLSPRASPGPRETTLEVHSAVSPTTIVEAPPATPRRSSSVWHAIGFLAAGGALGAFYPDLVALVLRAMNP